MNGPGIQEEASLEKFLAYAIGVLVAFAALARGAHDQWAGTLVYLVLMGLSVLLVIRQRWSASGTGTSLVLRWPLLWLGVAWFLSYQGAVHSSESFLELMDWGAGLLLFFLSLHSFRKESNVIVLLRILVPILWIELGVSAAQCVRWPPLVFSWETVGTLVDANIKTAFLLIWWPPLLAAALKSWRASKGGEFFYWGSGVVSVALGVLLAGSTWGVIGLIAAAPFSLGIEPVKIFFRKHNVASLLLAGGGFLTVGILIYMKFSQKIDWTGPLPPRSSWSRFGWWLSGLWMFKDHPFLGVGLGNFPSAYLAYKVGTSQHTLFPHSIVIGLLAETGVVGFSAFLLFLAAYVKSVRYHWNAVKSRWPYLWGVALLLVFSLVNIGMEYLVNLMLLWIFLAIGLAPAAGDRRKGSRLYVIIFCAALFGLVPFLLSSFMASQNVVYAQARLEKGDLQEAIKSYSSAAELDPSSAEAFRGWARALYLQYRQEKTLGSLKLAIDKQRQAIDRNKLMGVYWWELGKYLEESQEIEESRAAYRQAARLHRSRFPWAREIP